MSESRQSRQSFLGPQSGSIITAARVAVLGLGGGGSHIVQQLAHVGFKTYLLCDPDIVEDTNLNRLIGATVVDAQNGVRKVDVAARQVCSLVPGAQVELNFARWETVTASLREADVIFGCLDGYALRRDLEAFTRRFLIPLIDIGLDVHLGTSRVPQMSGQVILSMPGGPCMRCMNFLNDIVLANEAAKYGEAGVRPQVVWGNGVLASTAVGVAVDLLTGWARTPCVPVYLEYDGNSGTLNPSVRLQYLPPGGCSHYPSDQVGSPQFKVL